MRDIRRDGAGVLTAWRILTDFPLPEALDRGDAADGGARVLVWFPLLGAVCGALIAAAGALLAVVSNRFAGAALFAGLAGAFIFFKDSGRALMLLTSFLLDLCGGDGFYPAVAAASSERSVLERRFGGLVAGILAGGALLILFLIGLYGGKGVLVPLFAAEFSTQGEFAAALDPASGGIADPERAGRRIMWIVCGVLAAAMLPFFPTATAFGALVVCLVNLPLRDKLVNSLPLLTADTVTWTGGATEALLLGCAFLWTIG